MFHGVLSESELLLMKYLWDEEERGRKGIVFADIMTYAQLRLKKPWKKQTVNTFLSRLRNKNFIVTVPERGKNIYKPSITRADYFRQVAAKISPDARLDFPDFLMEALCASRELTQEEKEELTTYIENL